MLAAVAFTGFVAAFGWELFSYQHKVIEWASRDLQSRVDLAAANLEEPLKTQDFRRLHAFAEKVRADGYRLTVFNANGHGRVFDTDREGMVDQFHADQRSGEYLVRLWMPRSQVLKPFLRALVGVALSALVGVAGVFLFFVVTYRQRVKIRELAKLERFRREFVADVSHEIKTPLTGILGAADLMDGDSPLVAMIKKEAKRLNALVQQILDLARLEREGDALNREQVDVSSLVRDVAVRYRVTADADAAPDAFAADPQLLEQALSNLVENALRHSGSTEIVVSCAADARMVRLAVEDRGVGIPPEHVARIFERFHRVDPARAAESGGAGLGLAIVRRIARLHGGDVAYAPVSPHGSRFTISLPLIRR